MRLRQMPELYLRGSLAQETMKQLTPQQRQTVDDYTKAIMASPRLAANRSEFSKMLGQTIAGDYRENHATADQEFLVAIWRGVVHLLYHRDYQFCCGHCGEGAYLTKRNKLVAFDRRYQFCPNCEHVELTDPGDSGLQLQPGQPLYLHKQRLQELVLQTAGRTIPTPEGGLRPGRPPQYRSCISATGGAAKVADPHIILDDPEQRNKFFSEFVWNYFRQILNENEIRHHHKEPRKEYGFADMMAVAELRSLLSRHKTAYRYYERSEPEHGFYHLHLDTGGLTPEFVVDYVELAQKYRAHGVLLQHEPRALLVPHLPAAPLVEALVVRPTPVLMAATQSSIDSAQDDSYTIDRVEFKLVGGVRTAQENPMHQLESTEVVELIRASLPDGHCRDTYDLITGQGELYERHSDQAGSAGLFNRPGQIAKILGITPREATKYFEKIKVHMLAHGLTTPEHGDDDFL